MPPADLNPSELLLGVDAGGSKTTAWLARYRPPDSPEIIGRGSAAAANPRSVGMIDAAASISAAVDATFLDATLSRQMAHAAVLAVAGTADPKIADQLRELLLGSAIAQHVCVVSDAVPLLVAGTPSDWGVALVAGTGSFALGRDADGQTATAGGMGYLIGDEGSGYWLGAQALGAVTGALDERRSATALTEKLLAELSVTDADGVKVVAYDADDPRCLIASLAPLVIECAEAGDTVASDIVDRAAVELADLVATVAKKLGWTRSPFPLVLSGSVLSARESVRHATCGRIRQQGLTVQSVAVVGEPVQGCIELAAREATASR